MWFFEEAGLLGVLDCLLGVLGYGLGVPDCYWAFPFNGRSEGDYPKETIRSRLSEETIRGDYSKETIRGDYSKETIRGDYPKEIIRGDYSKETIRRSGAHDIF